MFGNNIKVLSIKSSGYIKKIKQKLITAFKMVDIEPISFYFGQKIERN